MPRSRHGGRALTGWLAIAALACGPARESVVSDAGTSAACPPAGGQPDLTGEVTFDSLEVDRDARASGFDTTWVPPKQPGRAVARFVIDATGRADVRTLTIEPAGDAPFDTLARRLVPRARFEPAMLHGCLVRVWARWPFSG